MEHLISTPNIFSFRLGITELLIPDQPWNLLFPWHWLRRTFLQLRSYSVFISGESANLMNVLEQTVPVLNRASGFFQRTFDEIAYRGSQKAGFEKSNACFPFFVLLDWQDGKGILWLALVMKPIWN